MDIGGDTMTDIRVGHTESTHTNRLSHGKVTVLYHASALAGTFGIDRGELGVGAQYTLNLSAADTYEARLGVLHEYAHYILCVYGGRDYRERLYGSNAHATLEEEALAWALALRWVRAPLKATRVIVGDPRHWLRGYVGHWASTLGSRRLALRWLQAAVKVVDTIYETGEWPDSKARWVEAPE